MGERIVSVIRSIQADKPDDGSEGVPLRIQVLTGLPRPASVQMQSLLFHPLPLSRP